MNGHQKQKQQSVRMIESALLSLMREKDFQEITVTEIVKRADVARRTFYRLYSRKEDVLHCCFRRLGEEYLKSCSALKKYDIEQIAEEFFGFWYLHREFLMLLHRCQLEDMFFSEIRQISDCIVRERIGENIMEKDVNVLYFVCYSTGGFLMLLHQWIAEGMREQPEKYARKISTALLKFIGPFKV